MKSSLRWTLVVSFLALLSCRSSEGGGDLSGSWKSDMGRMTLEQKGQSVQGSYDDGLGQISGEIKGDTLFFTWKELTGKGGDGFWEIKENGTVLVGKFRQDTAGPWMGTWRARKEER